MNGVHDMGGMHGHGPIVAEPNEPVFHAPWEARVFAFQIAAGLWPTDEKRRQRELIPAADYLRMSYYEKWYAAMVEMLVHDGIFTRDEIASGRAEPGFVKNAPKLSAEQAASDFLANWPSSRDLPIDPAFKPGEAVRARNINPVGHTRLPRYVRAKVGTIQSDHGVHVFADTMAHGLGEQPQHLYSVRFEARQLWGDAASRRDAVYLDLWESYLEPISQG
jgi:nitrile hydratase beta subunit